MSKKKLIANFGDVNYLEHEGQLLYEEGGRYFLECICIVEDEQHKPYKIYRFDVGQCNPLTEWFHDNLHSIASNYGTTAKDLCNGFLSDDPCKHVESYLAVASYHGYYEFDQYPLSLSTHEAYERYDSLDDCPCIDCSCTAEHIDTCASDDLNSCYAGDNEQLLHINLCSQSESDAIGGLLEDWNSTCSEGPVPSEDAVKRALSKAVQGMTFHPYDDSGCECIKDECSEDEYESALENSEDIYAYFVVHWDC